MIDFIKGPQAEKITKLVREYQVDQSVEKRNTIVEECMGMIVFVAKRYKKYVTNTQELYGIGFETVIKCLKNFDLSVGVTFSTYLIPSLEREIRRSLGIQKNRRLKDIERSNQVSLSRKHNYDFTMSREEDPSEVAEHKEQVIIISEGLDRDLAGLTDIQKASVISYATVGRGYTGEVSRGLNVSKQHVHQSLKLGLEKLRNYVNEANIQRDLPYMWQNAAA